MGMSVHFAACRKEWAEKAFRGDSNFDVNVACRTVDHELLNRARVAYKADSPAAQAQRTVLGGGRARFAAGP